MYYVYILYSPSSDKFYIGHSDDPWRRHTEHNESSHNTFTSKHRPWNLVAVFEAGTSRANAFKIELFLKKQKSSILLKKIVNGEPLTGELAQLVRVPHVQD